MGNTTVGGLLDVVDFSSFELNVFKGAMLQAKNCQELEQCEGEPMIERAHFRKELQMKRVAGVRRKAVYYMQKVGELLGEQVWLSSGLTDVMFCPKQVGGKDGSWE